MKEEIHPFETSHKGGRHRAVTASVGHVVAFAACLAAGLVPADEGAANGIRAGAAKIDITSTEAGPVNDPLYVRSLVLENDSATVAIITVDAVAIGEIGYIGNDYLK